MKNINSLKSRLSSNNILLVQNENGHLCYAGFEWRSPATDTEISKFEKANKIMLPDDYKEFLKTSNGATLFKDIEYGQWGCVLYGLDELIEKSKQVKNAYGDLFKESWLVFAEWLGDGDLFIFDLEKVSNNEKKYLLYGGGCDSPADYRYLRNFEIWLDRLIVAQGAKYWLWF